MGEEYLQSTANFAEYLNISMYFCIAKLLLVTALTFCETNTIFWCDFQQKHCSSSLAVTV